MKPVPVTGEAFVPEPEAPGELPAELPDDDDELPGAATLRMCDRASHSGLHRWMANTATTASTKKAATQVTTFRDVGARSRRRALATARLECLISCRGTTGNVPVGGPGATPYP